MTTGTATTIYRRKVVLPLSRGGIMSEPNSANAPRTTEFNSRSTWLMLFVVGMGAAILGSTFRPGETDWDRLPRMLSYFLFLAIAIRLVRAFQEIAETRAAVARIEEHLRTK